MVEPHRPRTAWFAAFCLDWAMASAGLPSNRQDATDVGSPAREPWPRGPLPVAVFQRRSASDRETNFTHEPSTTKPQPQEGRPNAETQRTRSNAEKTRLCEILRPRTFALPCRNYKHLRGWSTKGTAVCVSSRNSHLDCRPQECDLFTTRLVTQGHQGALVAQASGPPGVHRVSPVDFYGVTGSSPNNSASFGSMASAHSW